MPVKKVKSQNLEVKSTNKRSFVSSKLEDKKSKVVDEKKAASVRKAKTEDVNVEKKVVEEKKQAGKGVSVDVRGLSGKVVGFVSLPAEIFASKVNPQLMAQAVRVYLANQRVGSASTKTRGEVRGSTRKIYRQKGTGRARHGGIRAPIFVGGGIAFGPRPRDFSLTLPKKMRRQALFSALSAQFQDKKVIVADTDGVTGKTSQMYKMFKALDLFPKKKSPKILFVVSDGAQTAGLAARNIEGVSVERAENLHTYEVLTSNHIVFLKDAIEVLKKTFLSKKS